MIEFKPIDPLAFNDPELKAISDERGWITLPADVTFKELDFKVAVIKIDDIVYAEPSAKFWNIYRKTKTWDILAND